MYQSTLLSSVAVATLVLIGTAAHADQVIHDDLIVTSSFCVGFDCVNGEVFDFDTLRLKENNLRIKFMDTSNSPFPNNDWELAANESNSGGRNFLAIRDCGTGNITGQCGNVVFAVEANAPANALYVTSAGRVGIRTASPVLDLNIRNGNTPGLRLEQDGSSGFTPQTWDLAGNEANFFLRDVTNGSRLPFRVLPNAPSNSIFVAASGNVGLGTSAPSQSLHVRRTDGTAQLLVEEASGTTANNRIQMQLTNNGASQMAFVNSNDGSDWRMQNFADSFRVTKAGTGATEMLLDASGNMTLRGTLTQGSDKNAKMAILPVDSDEILGKVATLPISSWTYIMDAETGIRHIGPMAQDFYALFGTGASETGISTLDTSGVALAAIKALAAQNAELRDRLESVENRIPAN